VSTAPTTTGPTDAALVPLGEVRSPHHPAGQLWLRVGGTPEAPAWAIRYDLAAGPSIEAPIWKLPQTMEHWWVLHVGRARAVRKGLVPLTAIPPIRELGMLNAIPPTTGVHLVRVVLSTEPGAEFAGWEFATIHVRPAALIELGWRLASDTDDQIAGDAADNAVILAASDHPELRRLYVTHGLHATDREKGGALTLMFEPYE
jgi:hypothetical protein